MEKVIVYSLPNCSQCEATKTRLKEKNVDFESVDLLSDKSLLTKFKSMGYKTAPIVVHGEDIWNGYQPEKIDSLVSSDNDSSVDEVWDF